MKIDVTTTATIRPELLEKTFKSFYKYMFKDTSADLRLIMNIDPIGEPGVRLSEMTLVAAKYFGSDMSISLADTGNFSAACKRVWSAVEAPYLFNLEDDWELLRHVDLDEMIRVMDAHSNLAILRLPFTDSESTRAKQWNLWYPWNGVYFQCPAIYRNAAGFCGHPSLIRTEFMEKVANRLRTDMCPEKQIKGQDEFSKSLLSKWEFGVFQKPHDSKAIRDIGRQWRYEHNFQKNNKGAYYFTTWEQRV